jgi:hypothetical protein
VTATVELYVRKAMCELFSRDSQMGLFFFWTCGGMSEMIAGDLAIFVFIVRKTGSLRHEGGPFSSRSA